MNESFLIRMARQWVIAEYPYNSYHLLQSLVWIDRISPDSREAARLATLTHDMERAFPGPDQPHAPTLIDPEYNKAHSERSARIVGAWLRENGGDCALVYEVEDLVRAHEVGGWPEANMVQAADSLSLLEVNVGLFLEMARSGRRPIEQVREKFAWSYERIQVDAARQLAEPLLEQAYSKLAALERELAGASA